MSTRLAGVLIAIVAALAAATAQARDCAGVGFADQIQPGGVALTLNGLGLRQATFLKVDVYVAGLYLPQVSSNPMAIIGASTPRVLILHFVRDVGRGDLNEGWDEGFAHNAGAGLAALKPAIDAFKALMPDLRTGQRLGFRFTPGTGVQVDLDGSVKGSIAGDDFARALLSIWLGAHPPNDELKAGLLGGACG